MTRREKVQGFSMHFKGLTDVCLAFFFGILTLSDPLLTTFVLEPIKHANDLGYCTGSFFLECSLPQISHGRFFFFFFFQKSA